MIQAIGLMIGPYILTRMISFILRSGERAEPLAVKICAGITAVMAILMMIVMLTNGGAQ